jgi:hypothetical protein
MAFVYNCFYFFQDGRISFEADLTCEMTLIRAPATLPLGYPPLALLHRVMAKRLIPL